MSTNTRYALLGVRHTASARNIVFDFIGASVISASNDDFLVEVFFGGTTAGVPTWNAVSFTNAEAFNSSVDIGGGIANKVHSGGVKVLSFYLKSNGGIDRDVKTTRKLGTLIDGTSEELFVCVTPLTNQGEAFASISWREFI